MPISFLAGELYHETVAKELLQFYEHTAQIVWNRFTEATWNYVTNITKKNRKEMVWYHFRSNPFSPEKSRGLWNPLHPLSRARGKREAQKYVLKQATSSVPLGGTKGSLGKNLLMLSPYKYHLLAFRDPGSLLSPC